MQLRSLLSATFLAAALGPAGSAAFAQEAGNVFNPTVQSQPYLEPHIPRPEQDAAATQKLADLEARAGRKPNILLLLVDDMGWGDPGVYGGGIAVGAPTPNIDQLAREGLRLTSTYAQPTCTPTRAAILTGRIPTRSGLTRPTLSGENPTTNPWDIEASLPGLLSEVGYRTALAGKVAFG